MYNIGGYVQFDGALDVERMARAFAVSLDQHPQLRDCLASSEGWPTLHMAEGEAAFVVTDLSDRADPEAAAMQVLRAHFDAPFDLSVGPLHRAGVIRLGRTRHWYYTIAHHLNIDGWGYTNWLRDVFTVYRDGEGAIPPLPRLAPQEAAHTPRAGATDFWTQEFAALPDLLWPPAATGASPQSGSRRLEQTLPPALAARLRAHASASGQTEFTILLAVLRVCLYNLGGQDEVVVGIPIHNRRNAAQRKAVSLAMQVCPLRMGGDPHAPFDTLCDSIARRLRQVYRYSEFPLSRAYREFDAAQGSGRPHLFDVTFNYQRLDFEFSDLGLATQTHFLPNGHEAVPLGLTVCEYGSLQPICLQLDYRLDHLDQAQAEAFAASYLHLLEHALDAGPRPWCEWELLRAEDRERLQRWGEPAVLPTPRTQWRPSSRPLRNATRSALRCRLADCSCPIGS
jgi:hypothetical protein